MSSPKEASIEQRLPKRLSGLPRRVDELLAAINGRAPQVEVVVTGRYAPPGLIDAVDLVTEMCEVKHYYTKGIQAREGIEK